MARLTDFHRQQPPYKLKHRWLLQRSTRGVRRGRPRASESGRGCARASICLCCVRAATYPQRLVAGTCGNRGPLAEEGGVCARVCLAAGARLSSLVLCTCAFVPTEASRWDPRKGGPACRGRWEVRAAVRAAASLGARWEAPRSPAPSSPLLPGLSVRWVPRVPRAQVSLDRVRGKFRWPGWREAGSSMPSFAP
jgi:hypothetical protein